MRQTLVIDKHGVELEYDNACLVIRCAEDPTRRIPLRTLERVVCMHHAQLHTQALAHLLEAGVDFVYVNSRNTDLCFGVHAQHVRQCERRCLQYQLTTNRRMGLEASRRLVRHKLYCCLQVLSQTQSLHVPPVRNTPLDAIRQLRWQSSDAPSLDTLRGIEGNAQRLMFAFWRSQLAVSLGFAQRQRRPPPDPVNAMLSLTYTLVYHESIRQCLCCGLDPWLGFYHRQAHARQSLACDLMEPLRPYVEQWVVGLFRNLVLQGSDFGHHHGACMLAKDGRQTFYKHWYEQLPTWSRQLQRIARIMQRYLDSARQGNCWTDTSMGQDMSALTGFDS